MNRSLSPARGAALLFLCCAASLVPVPSGAGPKRAPGGASARRNILSVPKPGSPERKAILDAARAPIQKDLKQRIVFVVRHLATQDGWAFLYSELQRPDGKRIDYSRTRYRDAVEAGAFDSGSGVLLRKRGGQWRVVQYALGPTDVAWDDWDRRYGAPRAIFRMR